jgi:hypothetical protein
MRWITPRNLIIVGTLMMIAGVVFPLLMVIKVLESTFLLNFVAYISSIIGMMIGIIGAVLYSRIHKE